MMEHAYVKAAMNDKINDQPFCDIYHRDMSEIFFNQVTPLGNSLLHVAASSGSVKITELMALHFPSLLTKRNTQDDTALHVAARAGKFHTAKILVDYAKQFLNPSESQSLLKSKNCEGNTALHEALLALPVAPKSRDGTGTIKRETESNKGEEFDDRVSLARFLVHSADPEVCLFLNKAGKSPLCQAVECDNMDILEHILKAMHEPENDDRSAIGNCLVQLMMEKKVKLEALKLINKVKPNLLGLRDKKENTLLHGAASTGYLEGVCCLLKIKSDSALERNNEGFYAIHFACENGYAQVMEELLKKWPYPTELLNKKCQNILHIAAKSGDDHTVRRILKLDNSDMLINMMDDDGNTPLHLAAWHCNSLVVGTLILNKRTKVMLMNKRSQTAYDMAVTIFKPSRTPDEENDHQHIDLEFEYGVERSNALSHGDVQDQQYDRAKNTDRVESKKAFLKHHGETEKRSKEVDQSSKPSAFQKLTTLSVLFFATLRNLKNIDGCFRVIKALRNQWDAAEKENITQRINNFLVVATLIVGVAFAASVQVGSSSGGSETDYDHKSNANNYLIHLSPNQTKLVEDSALQSFTVFDTVAMNAAIIGATMLCWAQLIHTDLASLLVLVAYALAAFGVAMIEIAFFCSILLRMHNYSKVTLALVYLVHVFSFFIQLLLSMAVLFSPVKEVILLSFYSLLFWPYYFLSRFTTFVISLIFPR